MNGIQKYQQGGLLTSEDATGAGDLRSLAAGDPARELDVFEEIVAAFAGNSRCKGVAVREGPPTRREPRSSSRLPIASAFKFRLNRGRISRVRRIARCTNLQLKTAHRQLFSRRIIFFRSINQVRANLIYL